MGLAYRDTQRSLRTKLRFDEDRGRDHIWYKLWLDDRIVAKTKMSHSKKDLGEVLVGKMARQVHLTSGQFKDAIICPMSRDEYYSILREKLF